jgi:hypothetical protein
MGAVRVLELGTSKGYPTVRPPQAVHDNNGPHGGRRQVHEHQALSGQCGTVVDVILY